MNPALDASPCESMIEVHGLYKTFNSGTPNEVRALQGIDLEVSDGEFITLIGTNGSGKSTLLNAIAGGFAPDAGSIHISRTDVTRMREHRRARDIARVFQNPFTGTAPSMTIAENMHTAFLRGRHHWPQIGLTAARRREYRDHVALLEMKLEDRLDTPIGTLSGGQRQALTLLMAVLRKPRVLLLDEHTAALDPKSAAQIIALTSRFIEQYRLTALMVTHSMQQALDLGNRTIMLHKGKIVESLTAHDKRLLTVDDLLNKFALIRKAERLTPEMIDEFRRQYR
jgi:putative ABC transport system ATP-binding protein